MILFYMVYLSFMIYYLWKNGFDIFYPFTTKKTPTNTKNAPKITLVEGILLESTMVVNIVINGYILVITTTLEGVDASRAL